MPAGADSLASRLARARQARGWSEDEVCRQLLLSRAQVRDLEAGQQKAFYTPYFHDKALRKYAALLGVALDQTPQAPVVTASEDDRRDTRDATPPDAEGVEPVAAAAAPSVETQTEAAPEVSRAEVSPPEVLRTEVLRTETEAPVNAMPRVLLVVAAGVLLVALIAWAVVRAAARPDGLPPVAAVHMPMPLEAVPLSPPWSAIAPQRAVESAAAAPGPAADDGTALGAVTAAQRTWLYVRYANGTVDERSLEPGGRYVLAARPVFLAVGTSAVTLEVRGRYVPVDPWIVDGQVRLGRMELAALPGLDR